VTVQPVGVVARLPRPFREFLETEYLGALLLLVATVVALAWANSPWFSSYESLWHTHVEVSVGSFSLDLDLQEMINDGLMTLFFFVVGLEIKRELVDGDLKDRRAAALPALGALGGMVVPALIFVAINIPTGTTRGWGIPMATDIAFTLGVVALFGSRLPTGVRLFLLTLAVVDDIGAIAVIGIFYSGSIDVPTVLGALGVFALIVAFRAAGVSKVAAYVPLGLLLWLLTFESGVHATIAGVALGLLTPARPMAPARVAREWADDLDDDLSVSDIETLTGLARSSVSVAERLEYRLHPYTAYLIIPLFALANAGVRINTGALGESGALAVGIGTAAGLVVGKAVGVSLFSWIAVRSGIGSFPPGMTLRHLPGAAGVAGIGFTVSLFVATLAFPDDLRLSDAAKIGVLSGSLLASLVGAALLAAGLRRSRVERAAPTDGRMPA
jgi:Na+:H+ antiporter, NhaA family